MAYTVYPWVIGEGVTPTKLAHMETQYDEGFSYLGTHNHDSRYYTTTQFNSRYQQGNSPTGGDADTLEGAHSDEIADQLGIGGLIGLWETSTPPSGFVLCNGSNGAPDLRDKYILCAGGGYTVGETGGTATQAIAGAVTVAGHVVTLDELAVHNHTYYDYQAAGGAFEGPNTGGDVADHIVTIYNILTGYTGGDQAHAHEATVTGDSYDKRPKSKYLWYIMKT